MELSLSLIAPLAASTAAQMKIIFSTLLSGMQVTVTIFLLTLVFSLPLGLLVCFGRMARNPVIAWIFRVYISVMRGTPLMLQLFVVVFCPYYLFGISLSVFGPNWPFIAVIIGFVLNYAAYFAEIFRSGIASMPRGQYEAAKVLGYSRSQTFLRIILPQVIRRILPTVTNETITLVKDTSLAFSIGVIEMFTQAKQLANSLTSLLPFVAAGIFYFVFNFLVAFVMERVEKKMNYYIIR